MRKYRNTCTSRAHTYRVDVGVHQDGLVHISAMADTYVKDPRKGCEAR